MKSARLWFVLIVLLAVPATAFAQGSATVRENAPIHQSNSTSLLPMRVAAPGTVLKVTEDHGDWLKIQYNDPTWGVRVGWVQRKFVTYVSDALKPMDLSVPQGPVRPAADSPTAQPNPPSQLTPAPRNGSVGSSAGYSFISFFDEGSHASIPAGWSGSSAWRVGRNVAVVADFGGSYTSDSAYTGFGLYTGSSSIHTFLGGVRAFGSSSTVTPFVQVLGGLGWWNASFATPFGSASDSGGNFVLLPGAGVDVWLSDRAGVRFSGDYGTVFGEGGSTQALRLSVGIVFRDKRY
jgi:hypothetical protein